MPLARIPVCVCWRFDGEPLSLLTQHACCLSVSRCASSGAWRLQAFFSTIAPASNHLALLPLFPWTSSVYVGGRLWADQCAVHATRRSVVLMTLTYFVFDGAGSAFPASRRPSAHLSCARAACALCLRCRGRQRLAPPRVLAKTAFIPRVVLLPRCSSCARLRRLAGGSSSRRSG